MYLVFPLMLGTVLVGLQTWTHRAYSQLYDEKKSQIAADNAVFRVGVLDRALWSEVETANLNLERMHRAHHPLHLCARNPLTATKCQAADLTLENALRAFHRSRSTSFALRWQAGGGAIAAECQRLGYRHPVAQRRAVVPLLPLRCSACGLPAGWQIQGQWAATEVRVSKSVARVEWSGVSLMGKHRWNFRWVK